MRSQTAASGLRVWGWLPAMAILFPVVIAAALLLVPVDIQAQASGDAPNTRLVAAGADLQQALDQAAPGDTLVLEAGAVFTGNFVLRKKTGEGLITLITSAHDSLPPDNRRVSPADAANMPKLVSPNSGSVIRTEGDAHDYRFVGIEFTVKPGVYVSDLILLGSTTADSVDQLAYNFEFDRTYIHGDPDRGSKRGIAMNSRSTIVRNSYFTDFASNFQDAQDIAGWNGPGPYWIENNHFEASGMSVMFGGAAPRIPGLVPSDIFFYRNYVTRPMHWRGKHRIKNLFELKNARNVDIRYNVFENNWFGAQSGIAILFTVRTCEAGDYQWAVVKDINFSDNIIRNSEGGAINILGQDTVRGGCVTPVNGEVTTSGTQVLGRGTAFTSQLQVNQRLTIQNTARTIKEILSDDTLVVDSPFPADVTAPAAFGFSIPAAGRTANILIRNNLFQNIRPLDGSERGVLIMILSGADGVTIEHNTGFQGQHIIVADGVPSSNVIYRNNISPHNKYGIFGSGKGSGMVMINHYFPGAIVANNIIAGAPSRFYPADNFFPATLEEVGFVDLAGGNFALAADSPYKGKASDGGDPGADVIFLNQVMQDVVAGVPSLSLARSIRDSKALTYRASR
jgi:hypothetical protein